MEESAAKTQEKRARDWEGEKFEKMRDLRI